MWRSRVLRVAVVVPPAALPFALRFITYFFKILRIMSKVQIFQSSPLVGMIPRFSSMSPDFSECCSSCPNRWFCCGSCDGNAE